MEFHELKAYLESLGHDGEADVVRVLGESAYEKTLLMRAKDGEGGLFVRKEISHEAGCASGGVEAYRALLEMQDQADRQLGQNETPAEAPFPRVYAIYPAQTCTIVELEYLEGAAFGEYLAASPDRLAATDALFPQIAEAVGFLHGWSGGAIIHRDIKPGNILVCGGRVKLIDFGAARLFKENARGDTACFGTRGYAPPEQFGFAQTDVRSDVFALGQVLAFCLTGIHPYDRPQGWMSEDFAMAPELGAVIRKATELDPKARYRSVEELQADYLKATGRRRENDIPKPGRRIASTPPSEDAHGAATSNGNGNDGRSALRRASDAVPATLGIVWNSLLTAVSCYCIGYFFWRSIWEAGAWGVYPVWFRIILAFALVAVPVALFAAGVADKRRLRARFPRSSILKARWLVPASVGAWLVLFALNAAIAAILFPS